VVDAELRTVIAKESGFDLLNLPDPRKAHKTIPIPPAIRRRWEACLLKESHAKIGNLQKLVHCELLLLFEEHRTKFDMKAHTVGDVNIIGCIKIQIKQLAADSRLKKLDEKLKKKVKPGMAISVARAYSCPQKYREGWKTLIDQHYVAGCIWPSSSQYTSPSFIIPKADISVLP
jgi:hypothetical protein